MLISCLLTKFHTSSSHDSFVIPIKLRAKEIFRKTAILLYYVLPFCDC